MQLLAVLINPPPQGDLEGLGKLDRPPRSAWARTNVLLSEKGTLEGGMS